MATKGSVFMQVTEDRKYIVILTGVWLIVHVVLFQHYGIRTLVDGAHYIQKADAIIEHHKIEDLQVIFYGVFIGLLTLFRWLFPNQILVYLIVQSIISGFATLALYKAGERIFNDSCAGFFSGILFLLWFDNIHWNTAVMSESLMCSLICFMVLLLTGFKGTVKDLCMLVLLSIAILFTRPSGVVVVTAAVIFLLRFYWPAMAGRMMLKSCIVLFLLVVGYLGAHMMFTYWDFNIQNKKGNVVTYMDTLQGTPLYDANLQRDTHDLTWADDESLPVTKILIFVFYNPAYFIKTASVKIGYLMSSVRPYYSNFHNLYSFTWITFMYTLFYLGWRRVSFPSLKFFVVAVMVVNCLLIGICTVDWDNRFYIPMEPGVVLIAGGGLNWLFNNIKYKWI